MLMYNRQTSASIEGQRSHSGDASSIWQHLIMGNTTEEEGAGVVRIMAVQWLLPAALRVAQCAGI